MKKIFLAFTLAFVAFAVNAQSKMNGHEYVDLGLSVKWATCNVGASSPEDCGDCFAWGEISKKSTYDEKNCSTWGEKIGDIAGNPEYDVASAKWGGLWRLPTKEEMQELRNNCIWEWTTRKGVNGYLVTSKKNGNSIFLPAGGWKYGASKHGVDRGGYYWTSEQRGTQYAFYLYFYNGGDYGVDSDGCNRGRSVRPVTGYNDEKKLW